MNMPERKHYIAIYSYHAEKPTYQRQEIMTRQLMRTEINFALGKNGGYIPSSLGGRSIGAGRQLDKKFCNSTTSI